MPTPGHGTIGSLDYTPEERKVLAQRSVSFACEECGVASLLLAPPSGEAPSPARDQELRDILHSMALKSEEEILEEKSSVGLTPNPSTSADSQQTTGQLPVASSTEPAAAGPAAGAAAAVVSASSCSSGVGQSRPSTSAVYRSEEGAGNSRAFQLYDLLIMLVVALIGILIFRRIAITELQEGEPGEEHLHNENI